MIIYLVSLIIIVISIYSARYIKKLSRKIVLSRQFNGPPCLPLIGNGLLFFNKSAVELMKSFPSIVEEHGKTFRVWLGPDLILLYMDAKDVEQILSSRQLIDKSREYDYLRPWLNEGLLLSTNKKWFARRKAITPTFHFTILEQFVEIFENQGCTLLEILKETKKDQIIDIYSLITLYALDVICESAMGTTANAQRNSDSEYVQAVKEISNIIHLRMFDFLLRFDFLFNFSTSYFREKKALKILHGFTDSVIIARRNELMSQKNTEINQNEEDLGVKKKMALLDVLLNATIDGKPLSNLDIREEVDTFMFEGHDTTTSGISFTLYNIAKHPEVQTKVLNEIKEVLGDDLSKPVTLRDLNNLHYLDLVIKETLRLYPSVPILGRTPLVDTEINGKIIPAGANIAIGVYFMGRDASIFPDPLKFKPERFDVETSAEKMNPYAYVPFSAGPRNCIGQKFAVLEMKSIVSKVVRNFELSLPKNSTEPTLVAELILRPVDGVNLMIKSRT